MEMVNKDVLAAIDVEISRLQQARNILAGDEEQPPAVRRGRPPLNKQATQATQQTAKKRVGRPAGVKRVLSAEARKRIADAQKKRWAAQKAEQ